MPGLFRSQIQSRVPLALTTAVIVTGAAALIIASSVVAGGRRPPGGAGGGTASTGPTVNSTANDFYQPGTQPHSEFAQLTPVLDAGNCAACHGNYDVTTEIEPHRTWATSMMAMSARDPMFWAGLAVAVQDAPGSEHFCVRCHVPARFLSGDALPLMPDTLTNIELQGVNCSFCHRLVDSEYVEGVSPAEDVSILDALSNSNQVPPQGSNARYIFAPTDERRGPFTDINSFTHTPAPTIVSPFHQESEFCWNCHDVSNPLLEKMPGGTFQLAVLDSEHSTHSQEDMFPLHRTYAEWKNSYYFTIGGIQHNGRFGGNDAVHGGFMEVCQDCHMPDFEGFGCSIAPPLRPNIPQHSFLGANTWVQRAVHSMYPESETFLTDALVDAAVERNIDFLQRAGDLLLTKVGSNLRVRIINRTGHKLPTGFPDGRRMWINVKFFAFDDTLVGEHGGYDFDTADLDAGSTKVYEAKMGIDATQAVATGLPEGETLHFMLANTVMKDNRIPPIGYEPGIAEANGTKPVGASYASGQHWDDTLFAIPAGAARAVVTIYYQVTSKEFAEFLRDNNRTNDRGQVAYDKWVEFGKSTPVAMDSEEILVGTLCPADLVSDVTFQPPGDGVVNAADLAFLLGGWGSNPGHAADIVDNSTFTPPPDGNVDGADLALLLSMWGECPRQE
jgi:hypothetical protein